ncbi:MAG TPA: Ig-like domain-containing protein [Gaiellaceae bacterium]|nr:Ig-like domain-containing protein [Gaiellaceae bacterium]
MPSHGLRPLATLVFVGLLIMAGGAIAGSSPNTAILGEWGSSHPPRTPTITAAPSNPTTSTTATFEFLAKGRKTSYACRLDAGEFETCESPKVYSGLSIGVHSFEVVSVAGELRSSGAHYVWSIEPNPTAPPATPVIESGPPSVTDSRNARFRFSSETSGVSFLCRLDTASFSPCRSPKVYSSLPLGKHTFSVKARDAAGVESGVASLTWLIEDTPLSSSPAPAPPQPPATPTIDSGPPSVTTETTASFTFSSATPGVTYLCRLDGASFAACTSPKSYGSLATGEHRFEVKAQDAAGLESGVASFSWRIEAPASAPTPPPPPPDPPATPTIASGPNSITNSPNASFTFSSTTSGVTYLCRLDGASFAACTSPKTYSSLAAGQHRFEVKARSSSGLESGVASLTWTIDTAPPTVSITSPAEGSQVSNTITITVTAGDDVRVERVELRIDGNGRGTSTVAPHTFAWDTTKEANGQHVVEVQSYDVAGNASVPVRRTYTVFNQVTSSGTSDWSCSGVHVAPGLNTVAAAVAANPEGTTFCIRAGTHRFTEAVVPKSGQRFIGEPGAVWNGSRLISDAFVQSGSHWVASGMTMEGEGSTSWPDPCTGPGGTGGSLCLKTNDVYYDDRLLKRVSSLSELGPGRVFFDFANDRIYIADNPAGHKVEVGVAPGALRSWGAGGITNVLVKGLIVEKFANPIVTGALQGGEGWIFERNEIRLNHSHGIQGGQIFRDNVIHDNGQIGIFALYCDGCIAEGNEIYRNNQAGYICWEGGGIKFTHTRNAIMRNNYVRDDVCGGIWMDWNNYKGVFEGNRVEDVAGPGIFYEASCEAVIRNNTVRRTGFGPYSKGWIDGAGILVNSSRNVEIYGNTVEDNLHGIGGTYTERGSGSNCGTFELTNLRVHDNVVRVTGRDAAGYWRSAAGTVGIILQPYSQQALFDRNAYTICSQNLFAGPKAPGSTTYGYMSWSEWRAMGQDTNSTASFVC